MILHLCDKEICYVILIGCLLDSVDFCKKMLLYLKISKHSYLFERWGERKGERNPIEQLTGQTSKGRDRLLGRGGAGGAGWQELGHLTCYPQGLH